MNLLCCGNISSIHHLEPDIFTGFIMASGHFYPDTILGQVEMPQVIPDLAMPVGRTNNMVKTEQLEKLRPS